MSASSHLHIPGSRPDQSNELPFEITVRFSEALPDLLLTILPSQHATTSTLKQLIRAQLRPDLRNRRIRLIYAGKALADNAPWSSVFGRALSHPPSRTSTPGPYENGDVKAKGKEPIREIPTIARIYVHCSIGDLVLSDDELAAEAANASKEKGSAGDSSQIDGGSTTTVPAPRGFDRLVSAGFSAAEVQSLRMQFMAIQAHTHTPDTMPSPSTLRDLEDRWLDNSNGGEAGATGIGGLPDDDAQAGALDDMLWGAAMGFFWPVGCLFWGMREEGIWSQRRKMAIVVGVALNVGVAFVRYVN